MNIWMAEIHKEANCSANELQRQTMFLRNNKQGFGLASIVMHWLSAVLVTGLFALGLYMVELDYYSEWYNRAPDIHKALGMLTFFLIVVRLLWRWTNIQPQPLTSYSSWERWSSRLVHALFYLLLFVISISGYLISTAKGAQINIFEWFAVPAALTMTTDMSVIMESVHLYGAYAVIVLTVLHTAAAFKHHFIDKDETLKRIVFVINQEE